MPAIGAAVIGGGAALVGGAVSAHATSKASDAASAAAAQNAQIQQQQYSQTRSDLQPYTQGGYAAQNALLNQYGLGGGQPQQGSGSSPTWTPPGQPQQAAQPQQDWTGYVNNYTDLAQAWADPNTQAAWRGDEAAWGQSQYGSSGRDEGREVPMTPGQPQQPQGASWDVRPATGARPTPGAAPDQGAYFSGYAPSQQYKDELAQTTRSVNARAGMTGGYFSGGRALALQDNADRLYQKDYDNWWQRQNTLYQSALGQYDQSRAFDNSNYDVDQARSDAQFDTDRAYNTGRVDTRTNDLFRLTGIGQGAASATAAAGQNYANQSTANNNALASVQGNAAISGANSVNNLLGQGLQAYGLYRGGQAYGQPNYGTAAQPTLFGAPASMQGVY